MMLIPLLTKKPSERGGLWYNNTNMALLSDQIEPYSHEIRENHVCMTSENGHNCNKAIEKWVLIRYFSHKKIIYSLIYNDLGHASLLPLSDCSWQYTEQGLYLFNVAIYVYITRIKGPYHIKMCMFVLSSLSLMYHYHVKDLLICW